MPRSLGPLEGRDFAAVLFDMDGTLIDSIPVVVRSGCGGRARRRSTPAGWRTPTASRRAGSSRGCSPPSAWTTPSRGSRRSSSPTPTGSPCCPAPPPRCSRSTGTAHSAIVTSCTRPLAGARLAATGLPAPRVVVTASDVERGKPHPDPFLLAARRLSVDPADCLVVEDAPGGLRAARAAGCATLAVTTTTAAADLEADAVVDTLADVRFRVDGGRVLVTAEVTRP